MVHLEFSSTKKYTTYKYHIQAHSARLQSTRNDNGPFQNWNWKCDSKSWLRERQLIYVRQKMDIQQLFGHCLTQNWCQSLASIFTQKTVKAFLIRYLFYQ